MEEKTATAKKTARASSDARRGNALVILLGALIIGAAIVYAADRYAAAQKDVAMTDEKFAQMLDRYIENQQREQAEQKKQEEEERMAKAASVAPISARDHVKGPRDAMITIFEYSDFECPFCKRFFEVPGKVVAANSDVNAVYRHFPLGFHDPLATKQAIAAECAAQQGGDAAFFAYHDAIFRTTKSNGRGMKESQLADLARAQGLNMTTFLTCLADENGKMYERVQEDIRSGVAAGVSGTPGVIVRNNKTGAVRVLPGAVPVEMVQQAVDELRKESAQ